MPNKWRKRFEPENLTLCDVACIYSTPDIIMKIFKEAVAEKEWLGRLAQWDLVDLVKSLLETSELDEDALNYGFEQSLSYLALCCLEILIEYATEHNIVFRERHPFHLMYSTATSNCRIRSSYVECTRMLIKHGWSVKSAPSPLYSLIVAVKNMRESQRICADMTEDDHNDFNHGDYEKMFLNYRIPLDCLEALLNAGADPNLKEKSDQPQNDIKRKRNNSAAEALMTLLGDASLFETKDLWNFLSKAVVLLVEHGCDLSFVDENGQSFLHAAFHAISYSIAVNIECVAYIINGVLLSNFDEKEIDMMVETIKYAVKNGADLHARDSNGCFPLVKFTESLKAMNAEINVVLQLVDREDECNIIWMHVIAQIKFFYDFLNVMDQVTAREIVESSINIVQSNEIGFGLDSNGEQLLSLLRSYYPIRSLQSMCLLKVYHACKFQPEKLEMFSNLYMQLFEGIFPTVVKKS